MPPEHVIQRQVQAVNRKLSDARLIRFEIGLISMRANVDFHLKIDLR